jgi:signal peptidase I
VLSLASIYSRLEQPLSLDLQRDALTDAAHDQPTQRPKLGFRTSLLRDIGEVLLVILSIYTMVNLASARAIVEGSSMHPNFATGQLIIVNRVPYYYSAPERGDVVVLHNPRNVEEDYIKRVIGLPGETIHIERGVVFVNGVELIEPYIDPENFCTTLCDGDWALGQDEYFVLGDNRRNSTDSHVFGPIKQTLIIGKAWVRYWPLSDAGMIPHEDYSNLGDVSPKRLPILPTPTPGIQRNQPSQPSQPSDT